jgi:hypothetical protein
VQAKVFLRVSHVCALNLVIPLSFAVCKRSFQEVFDFSKRFRLLMVISSGTERTLW